MDYFSRSPFYDKKSDNEIIKIQQLPSDHLKKMRGIQFTIKYCNEDLFVIAKCKRESELFAQDLAIFYILHDHVMMSPDIFSVVQARLVWLSYSKVNYISDFFISVIKERSLYYYRKATEAFNKTSEYSIEKGRHWKEAEPVPKETTPTLLGISKEYKKSIFLDGLIFFEFFLFNNILHYFLFLIFGS